MLIEKWIVLMNIGRLVFWEYTIVPKDPKDVALCKEYVLKFQKDLEFCGFLSSFERL